MKKKLLFILVLILLIFIGFSAIFLSSISGHSFILKANWGISLPLKADLTLLISIQPEPSFHGDGVRYHMFSYEYEDEIENIFPWSSVEQKTRSYPNCREAAIVWLEEINVPENIWPNFSECLTWYHTNEYHNEVIFFWDRNEKYFYILEFLL